MDDELAELLPVFVGEARERLQRLSDLLGHLDSDAGSAAAVPEIQRELHTLKGAGRMMSIAPFGELCHAAEELLRRRPASTTRLLTAVHDALAAMVDAVEAGDAVQAAAALLAELDQVVRAGEPAHSDAVATHEAGGLPEPAGAGAPGAAADSPGDAVPDERIDAARLDAFAERGVRVRAAAVVAGRLLARLDELADLAEDGVRDPHPAQALAVVAASLRQAATEAGALESRLARTGEEQIEAVLALQIVPVRPLLQSLARYARDLARSLGREIDVTIVGGETRLDRRIARELDGALRHLIANAVDHGLEPPAERAAVGKPSTGRLTLGAQKGGRGVELSIEDDGRGIDGGRVAARAVEAGLLSRAAAEAMTESERLRLVLLPGLSTRAEASEVSGRGVGLDAAETAVARLGGEVGVRSTPGRGTTVVVDLPQARRGEQALIVRVGGRRLAVPAVAVRRVVALVGATVEERGGHRVAMLEGRLVPFVPLAETLGMSDVSAALLIEGSVAGRPVAFSVERVEGEAELLVRPLPRRAAASPLLDGAALLPSGEPLAVLAPLALLGLQTAVRRPAPPVAAASERARIHVLLVDDSRVTREMERRILEDAGFRVDVAGDGDEAMRRLAGESFDCLVTDIEMPGLDGFELTAELRRLERFARLPIVVVSTRERPEDRLRGLRAGADAYLTKQSLIASDLIDTVRRLTGGDG